MVSESVVLLTNGKVDDEYINVDNVIDEGIGGDGLFDNEYADLVEDSLYVRTEFEENANTTSQQIVNTSQPKNPVTTSQPSNLTLQPHTRHQGPPPHHIHQTPPPHHNHQTQTPHHNHQTQTPHHSH